jgi:hypothetical protein
MKGMTMRMFVRAVLPLVLFGAVASACSSSNGAGSAGDGGGGSGGEGTCAVANGCPDGTPPPSYANEIAPILTAECLQCHGPGGSAGYDESTYAKVVAQRSPMLDQVNGCLMPPVNGPAMSAAQRIALTEWLECGAPDN